MAAREMYVRIENPPPVLQDTIYTTAIAKHSTGSTG